MKVTVLYTSGIRSIVFNGHVMSIGSGIGNIFFFDLRTRKYLDLQCGHALSLKAGDGWLVSSSTCRKSL